MELENSSTINNINNIIKNQSIQRDDTHAKWLKELFSKYTNLIETQTLDYSPNTRIKTINNIWKNEQKNPPWLTRQHGYQSEN